jgi:hypothetical protein
MPVAGPPRRSPIRQRCGNNQVPMLAVGLPTMVFAPSGFALLDLWHRIDFWSHLRPNAAAFARYRSEGPLSTLTPACTVAPARSAKGQLRPPPLGKSAAGVCQKPAIRFSARLRVEICDPQAAALGNCRNCIVNLADPGRPFSGPARLERGRTIGEQKSSPIRAAAPPIQQAYQGRSG